MAKAPVAKALGSAAVAVAVLVSTAYVWARAAVERSWEAMRRRVDELAREIREEPAARPELRGEAVDGNAWDDYDAALAEFGRQQAALRPLLILFMTEKPRVPPTEDDRRRLEEGLDGLKPAFDLVLQGARRRESRRFPDTRPWPQSSLDDWRPTGLSFAMFLEARRRQETAEAVRALDLRVGALQFGRDFAEGGGIIDALIGLGVIRNATEELQRSVDERRWPLGCLDELEAALAILDRSFPACAGWRRQTLFSYGRTLVEGRPLRLNDHPAARPGWRHAWSGRALRTAAFFRADEALGPLKDADALPFAELHARQRVLLDDLRADRNPWVSMLADDLSVQGARPEYLARLRLLRIAVHYRRRGAWLDLEDPCGDRLRREERDGRIVLWSAGRDGVDHGGRTTRHEDVVVEMQR